MESGGSYFRSGGSDRQAESFLDSPPIDFVQPPCAALDAPIVVDAFDGRAISRGAGTMRSEALVPETVMGRRSCHA